MLTSLIGQIYHALGFLPFPRRLLVGTMIFAEYAVLGGSAFLCARIVNARLPVWTAVAVALLLTTGGLISCDLARWFHPYYGSAYNAAYGFGFASVAAMLARRPVWAGLSLGIAAAIHPIIGLFFGLAVAVVALVELREYRFVRLVAGGLVALVIAGGWAWLMLGGTGVSGDAVDPGLYIALTRLTSAHWFPISVGVFSDRAFETSIPFTGFMVVVVALLRPFTPANRRADTCIGAAIAILLIVTAIGVFASEYSGIPLVVKLALHRASSVVLLLGAIIVVPRLAADVVSGSIVRATLAALLLLLSFWREHGPPILLCLIFAGVVLFEERGRRPRPEQAMLAVAVVLVIALVAVFAETGAMPRFFGNANLGISTLREPLFLVAIVLAGAAWLLSRPAALAAAMAVGIVVWTPQVDPLRDPANLKQAEAYLEVQQWARANTPSDALFMVDPTFDYGWREMSERPSFGTMREWLYTGWIYDTKATVFNEGLRRARWLGLSLDRYLGRRDVVIAYFQMWRQAKDLYNTIDAERLKGAADKYGITYFVFDRRSVAMLPALPIVFENDRYAVLAARK